MEAQKLELKSLPPIMSYVFVGRDACLLVIVAATLNGQQIEYLVVGLKRFKGAIG